MAFSGVFNSVLSRRPDPAQPLTPEQAEQRRCEAYRRAFATAEIAVPALALRNRVIARWVRDRDLAVDVRTGEELEVAVGAGIHPVRITVHADHVRDSDLCATARLALGRIAVNSLAQIQMLATQVPRSQGLVVRMTDVNAPVQNGFPCDSAQLDAAIDAIMAARRFALVGLHCDVGEQSHDFLSYPAAIGHMITEMAQIRQRHGVVLTRLGLGGGRAVPSGDWAAKLPELASQIDEALDDACVTLRYPRPIVQLSPGLAIVGRVAA